jgi:tetratricopeptide (TPR) repeat protein/cellulose biosynthesis protein BcsQ
MMFIVTFYSYKGGVGRTLALVNSAFRLARKGKRVFILDFDLEAPGVDAFSSCGDGEQHEGVVEYISRFRADGKVDSLKEYVREIQGEETAPGKVFFMSAGRKDQEYQFLLSSLDWKYFYGQQKGFLFVENLKAAIENDYAPDYVLVDSRTGLTDISGICTLQLPNLVVLVFNLNNQNVNGIAQIYRSIRFNKIDKDIKTLLVASPIPDVPDYVGVRQKRFENAREKIGSDVDVILPFDAFVAFEETVLPEGKTDTYLSKQYQLLCKSIIKANSTDALTMLEGARQLAEQGNLEKAESSYQVLIDTHPKDSRAWFEYGRFLRVRGNKKAIDYFQRALELSPKHPLVLSQLIREHLDRGELEVSLKHLDAFLLSSTDAGEVKSLADVLVSRSALEPARRLYERAIELYGTPNASVFLELGNLYMRMKKPELALPQYERALNVEPSGLPYVYNCAYALTLLGDNARAKEFFERAILLFEQRGHAGKDAPSTAANKYQAISRAYAALNRRDKAREFLEKAIEVVSHLPRERSIFSSERYKEIPAREFVEETRLMLKKLKRKEDE